MGDGQWHLKLFSDPKGERWSKEAQRGTWLLGSPPDDPDLRIRFCFVETDDGPTCIGVMFDRDGQEITARDLRLAPLGAVFRFAHSFLRGHVRRARRDVHLVPRRPGAKGLPREHYADVWELYQQARQEAPREPIKWMRERSPASDATMRRWVARAREMFEGAR